MNAREEEFLKRLHAIFQVEAAEHIHLLSSSLIEMEKNQDSNKAPRMIELIMREAHSLKGAARSVNRKDIESICQALESIFAKLQKEKTSLNAPQFDLIHKTIDTISKLVSHTADTPNIDSRPLVRQLLQIISDDKKDSKSDVKISLVINPPAEAKKPASTTGDSPGFVEAEGQEAKTQEPVEAEVDTFPDQRQIIDEEPATKGIAKNEKRLETETVRIPISKLDPLFLQAEQMIQSKIAIAQWINELKQVFDDVGIWKNELAKRSKWYAAFTDPNAHELYESTRKNITELETKLTTLTLSFGSDQTELGRMIDEHLESMKRILMLPIATITEGFPKLVRDLARDQNKEIELVTNGKDTEVDKRILEELKDPLIHLIRNCIDHGIKKPAERLKLNKPPQGTITLNFIALDSRHLEITITDDGAGINAENVIAAAIKMGAVSKENAQRMSHNESLSLIFKSGLTTSPMITDISGRGLGLAIVREKVEKLEGTVSVESRPGSGTTFRIVLPLSLSTFRGVLVKTGEHLFFIPVANVQRVVRVNAEVIKTVENQATISLDNGIIAIVNLSTVLGLNNRPRLKASKKNGLHSNVDFIQIIIVKQGVRQIGFVVDEILDEHQILVKDLGKQLKSVKNISGATVLGSGKVVPLLHIADLLDSAIKESASLPDLSEGPLPDKIIKILVTEDSITSRTLIKDILETAGYLVETAVDGVDGYTKAMIGEYDLIVSDVDMPRMNGFELTSKIRSDKKLSETPVVLVTALESREDREHGIDVGASAYIIKSSFDQSNLIEVIQKLL